MGVSYLVGIVTNTANCAKLGYVTVTRLNTGTTTAGQTYLSQITAANGGTAPTPASAAAISVPTAGTPPAKTTADPYYNTVVSNMESIEAFPLVYFSWEQKAKRLASSARIPPKTTLILRLMRSSYL